MGIRIIKEEERLSFEKDGSTFYYRRIPAHVRQDILQRHMPRRGGEPNWEKVLSDMLSWALKGWDNILDDQGQQVEFSTEMINYLPQEVQVDLLDKLGANVHQLQGQIKN